MPWTYLARIIRLLKRCLRASARLSVFSPHSQPGWSDRGRPPAPVSPAAARRRCSYGSRLIVGASARHDTGSATELRRPSPRALPA